jgi:hypothetical protein
LFTSVTKTFCTLSNIFQRTIENFRPSSFTIIKWLYRPNSTIWKRIVSSFTTIPGSRTTLLKIDMLIIHAAP